MDTKIFITMSAALAEVVVGHEGSKFFLNDETRQKFFLSLPGFSRDPDLYAMVIRSNNEQFFCAGGDFNELLISNNKVLIYNELFMIWALECFTKPTVSLVNGSVLGAGAGLMLYGTHRVAGERFQLAIPETGLGFFPSSGICGVLSDLPGNIGRYLALTGRPIGPQTALRLGLATHCIRSAAFPKIIAALAAADPVDPLLDGLHDPPADDDELLQRAEIIEKCFGGIRVSDIMSALEAEAKSTGQDAEWCAGVLADLQKKSPISLCVTLRHLNECRGLSLREVLIRDYRLARGFFAGKDLYEGVWAALNDEDCAPKWSHSSVNEVKIEEIEKYFQTRHDDELDLPERTKMQKIRA